MEKDRRAFYIDGFNLYFGLRAKGWRKYYWLDLQRMCSRFLRPGQELTKIRYFTARISGPDKEKAKRQGTYLDALGICPKVEIHYGHYLPSLQTCRKCGHTFTKYNEKKSDVNIALSMLTDALDDLYDEAVLVSADGDLAPAVEAIRRYTPSKTVGVLFPPERNSASLKKACHFSLGTINEGIFKKSRLPQIVTSKEGFPLQCPDHWCRNFRPLLNLERAKLRE